MATSMNYVELTETTKPGKAICYDLTFNGYELDIGKGNVILHTTIRKDNGDGTYTYLKPADSTKSTMKVNIENMIPLNFNDGMGGTITGYQILNALANMVDRVWAGEFTS